MRYGLYSKTFRKSERRAYQGVRLDKPHKFPGNVGRMTSSSRCRETTGDLWKHSRRTNTNALSSMNYHPSLISLSTEELPKAWRASQEKENFSMYAWDPPSSSKFSTKGYRHCAECTTMWVTLGRRCWYPKGNSFLHPKYRIHHAGMTRGTTQ